MGWKKRIMERCVISKLMQSSLLCLFRSFGVLLTLILSGVRLAEQMGL